MNKVQFRQSSRPIITESISKNNPESTNIKFTYTKIINNIKFVYIVDKIKDKTGKTRRKRNIFQVNGVFVCKNVFFSELNKNYEKN